MNDDIFQEFAAATPPVTNGAPPEPAKPARKGRGPRKAAVGGQVDPPVAVNKRGRPAKAEGASATRKPRAQATPAKGTGKLDLSTILSATVGLSADEARMLTLAVNGLQKVSKKSRGKIVVALGRIFT